MGAQIEWFNGPRQKVRAHEPHIEHKKEKARLREEEVPREAPCIIKATQHTCQHGYHCQKRQVKQVQI